MWVDRDIHQVVAEVREQFPVLLLTGARQVGKTSLLERMFPDAHYVSLDDPFEASRAQENPADFINGLTLPVIIDEAQYAPNLFRYIKLWVDRHKKKGQFLLTGSQHFLLMQNVSESLAGRIGIVHMGTFSAAEVAAASKGGFNLERYIVSGGYPVLYGGGGTAKYWLPGYVSTYIQRDVRNIINVDNLGDYSRFLRIMALRSGQLLTLSDVARDVGVAPNTVKAWMSVLETSGLIVLLNAYYANLTTRLIKAPKMYFADTGLLCYLLGIESWSQLERSQLLGAVWETYAFGQLYKYFLNQGVIAPPIYFWRTDTSKEVDFVVEYEGKLVLLDAKVKEMPGRGDGKPFEDFANAYTGKKTLIPGFLCRSKGFLASHEGYMLDNGLHVDDIFVTAKAKK